MTFLRDVYPPAMAVLGLYVAVSLATQALPFLFPALFG